MLPHEVQENIVKVLFFVFAITVLCFSKARAVELSLNSTEYKQTVQNQRII